jgi:CopG family nickel-responsive transcriptional regulator
MTRISMNLPDELLNEFDEVLKQNRYNSRRNGLQDTIKEYINKHKIN